MADPSKPGVLQRLETRYAWGVLGFVVGVVGLVATFLSFRERRPEIAFSTVAESNVLDVHTPIAALDIVYRGESIQRSNLNLRILSLRVENIGDVDILQTQYDAHLPWGFHVRNGRIVEVRTVGASSQYLRDRFAVRRVSDSQVTFEKVVFDRGAYVLLQLLILHKKDLEPQLVPLGKIAGLDRFTIRRVTEGTSRRLVREVFSGSTATQVARLLAYGLPFVLLLLVVLIGGSELTQWLRGRKEVRKVREAEAVLEAAQASEETRPLLMGAYVFGGIDTLRNMKQLLNDPTAVKRAIDEHEAEREMHAAMLTDKRLPREKGGIHWVRNAEDALGMLTYDDLIERDSQGNVRVKEILIRDLQAVLSLIETKA